MRLDPVTTVPAYELVLDQLRRSINLGHFGPGDKLPPERDLAHQLGVSRTTVREAVRVLEGQGIVEVRRGSTGGILVRDYDAPPAELKERLREFDDVIDFRLAVEPMAARLAAQRRTQRDVRALAKALEALDALAASGAEGRVADWLRADTEYHLLIGRIARNERLARAIEEGRAGLFRPVGAVWGRLEDRAHDQHAEIHAAIVDGDAERAAAAMTAHLEATRADVHAITRRSRH
jgi:DNA-binding FadR family transcriptional regulator